MHGLIKSGLAALSIILSSTVSAADLSVGSWNVKRLGHGDQQSYQALGAIAGKFDIIALQEIMNEKGLDRLEAAIEKSTGEPWGRLESHLIGSRSYKEMYGFLYRESAVEYDEGAVVYLDRGDRFLREPFSAKFKTRSDNTTFALATVHILYGKGVADRTPEIKALAEYWQWLGDVYPGTERILVGDFNLAPDHSAWAPLKQYAKPLITQGATTLSGTNGRFANLYDNLWVARSTKLPITNVGIVNFPRMINWDHTKSRKHVSDHAPVFLTLGKGRDPGQNVTVSAAPSPVKASPFLEVIPRKSARTEVANTNAAIATGSVRGNRNSKIFHRPDCPSYDRISQKNRVEMPSSAAAENAGYRIAGNCR